METQRENEILKVIIAGWLNNNSNLVLSPNSIKLTRSLARLMCNPELKKLGVTLKEMEDLYVKICEYALQAKTGTQKTS